MYAQVVFPIASFKSFTYQIPLDLKSKIHIGSAVNAEFRKTTSVGYVISINNKCSFNGKILALDSLYIGTSNISSELWKVIVWMSRYYLTPIGVCIKAALPKNLIKDYNENKNLFIELTGKTITYKLSANQKKIFLKLSKSNQPILASSLKKEISNLYYVIETLSKKNIIKKLYLNKIDINDNKVDQISDLHLSKKQTTIFNTISPYINNKTYNSFLIHGVPGSGKTEIYIKLAKQTISTGKSVIILIPEIILSTHMQNRFKKYFGNSVAMWHSKMTSKEKQHTLKKISSGDYKIIIGARSCIFSPLLNLGLIVVDEEQDNSYKQESPRPYYNARDIAMIRASFADCPIVLTSATPCLESYHNTLVGKIDLLTLKEKYYPSQPPKVQIVNMFNENNKILSADLLRAIEYTLINKKQCILLNNRRGYATSIFSMDSNKPLLCNHCNVPMSYHKINNILLCHYCNETHSFNPFSNNHSMNNIMLDGYGTQKVCELLLNHFPNAIIQRADSDSLSSKVKLKKVLNNFSKGDIDILVGTQMISKGLDFNNVTLVGVINSDYGMFTPDFRSGERIFQIISQIIGRAGRRKDRGEAIIQTYNPKDSNLIHAIKSNSKSFYMNNLAERNELQYPPFTRLCRITFSGKNINKVLKVANHITNKFSTSKLFKVLGPAEAPISKIKNNWRINSLIIASKKNPMEIQEHFQSAIGIRVLEKPYNEVKIKLDIDPINML